MNAGEIPPRSPGLPGYVQRDWEVIDYECFQLPGTDLWFRGPAPDLERDQDRMTILGAAQSFGCFVDEPYGGLLADSMQMQQLNLGYSGAGPAFFLRHSRLVDLANAGRMCIVQVMSGRSTSNSVFESPDGLAVGRRRDDGRHVSSEDVFRELLADRHRSIPLIPKRVVQTALRVSRLPIPAVRRVVEESRRQWVADMVELLDRISVPTVVLWFSVRRPAYRPRYHTGSALLGEFPHLVDDGMISEIRTRSDAYVESVSDRGRPQQLISRFTGAPTTVDLANDHKELSAGHGEAEVLYTGSWDQNIYYPTPEMHQDAAAALVPACRRLASSTVEDTL